MSSIISFGNVRMSSMGKNLVTSYAALGVGLALVLTFGLTAISSINTQVYDSADRSVFIVTDPDQNLRTVAPGPQPTQEAKSTEGTVPAPPPESAETEENASAKLFAPPASPAPTPPAATGGATAGEVPIEGTPAQEHNRENYLVVEAPASSSPFAGILVALPYIAAAAVGTAVFAVTRKRAGW